MPLLQIVSSPKAVAVTIRIFCTQPNADRRQIVRAADGGGKGQKALALP